MVAAFLIGVIVQSSLLLSGLAAYGIKVSRQVIGGLAGFGAGALIVAVAFELVPDARQLHLSQVAFWMLAGALIFMIADRFVEEKFGKGDSGGALSVILGSIVDGIPSCIILGIQIASGEKLSIPFVAAVFVSNIPQGFAPSAELAQSGRKWQSVGLLWLGVVVACGLGAALGYLAASAVNQVDGLRMSALAAGGILALLSDSLIPFAHERSERAGLWSVFGFCAALAIS